MRRKIYDTLLNWKKQWNGQTALLIDGARRVGKSWIVEEFARREYESYILIDFGNVLPSIKGLFESELGDLDSFFSKLCIYTRSRLSCRKSVIIFDEVQMFPKARAAIKYLVKDGRYDYIETGSLVSINKNVKDIVIPSEEVRVDMHPMDFEEFLWATGQEALSDYIRSQFNAMLPLGKDLHREAMEALRSYLIVGGMPQAVLKYLEHKDFREVDAVKRNILALYRNDISKYAGRQGPKTTKIFDNIPGVLQKHEKRFKPCDIKKDSRLRDYAQALYWIEESRVVNICYGTTEPSVGLALKKEDAKLKIYMADTGLLLSMAFDEGLLESDGIYEKLLRGKLEFNQGLVTENLVAQLLRSSGHPLYFYSSFSNNAEDRMEVDFLIRKANVTSRHNISLIEVKSSVRYTLTSLQRCKNKFANQIGTAYVLHSKDLELRDETIFLPLYMAGLI